jgi:hypothetical protein
LTSAWLDSFDVVAQQSSNGFVSALPSEFEAPKMCHVEEPDSLAHRPVFGKDRFVLHWHLPTAELDKPGA